MKESSRQSVKVEGMTCTNCALNVTRSLEKLGLENVQTDFISGEAAFDANHDVSFEMIRSALDKTGYKALPAGSNKETTGYSSIEKKFFFSLLFTMPLFLHMFFAHDFFLNHPLVQLILCLPVFALGFFHFGKSGLGSLKNGVPNMDVLIWIGSTAAFVYSVWGSWQFYGTHQVHNYLFFETAATIITLVFLGNVIEHRSVRRTTSAITELVKLKKSKAVKVTLHNGHEHFTEVSAELLMPGDRIRINNGDRITADGIILSGNALINESMLTGESLPVNKPAGAEVYCGTIVTDGSITVKVMRAGDETVLSNIIQLVKDAQHKRPAIQKLGDRISAVFVPVVVLVSLLTFFVAWLGFSLGVQQSLMQAIAVLVISCPCAMGLAAPTAVAVALGRSAKRGMLIKGGDTLEQLASVKTVVFDKTGTLTTGDFKLTGITTLEGEEENIRSVIYSLERFSSHPLAKSIVKELEGKTQPVSFSSAEEIKGEGIKATDQQGNTWLIGKSQNTRNADTNLYALELKKNNKTVAELFLADEIKSNTAQAIEQLKNHGIHVVMLSGDNRINCEWVGKQTGITEIYSEKKPGEKQEIIRKLNEKNNVAMAGDGINDAPSLAQAAIGISMGDATQVAIHAAQVVILKSSDLRAVPEAILLGKHTVITIKQNFFWAFFYNVIAIPVAAAGFLNPMIAALSMAFSDVVVVGNSIRLKTKKLT